MVNNYQEIFPRLQFNNDVKNKVIALKKKKKNTFNKKKKKINQLGLEIYVYQTHMGVNTYRAVMVAGDETSCWKDVGRI